jgi:hypothetical protein
MVPVVPPLAVCALSGCCCVVLWLQSPSVRGPPRAPASSPSPRAVRCALQPRCWCPRFGHTPPPSTASLAICGASCFPRSPRYGQCEGTNTRFMRVLSGGLRSPAVVGKLRVSVGTGASVSFVRVWVCRVVWVQRRVPWLAPSLAASFPPWWWVALPCSCTSAGLRRRTPPRALPRPPRRAPSSPSEAASA